MMAAQSPEMTPTENGAGQDKLLRNKPKEFSCTKLTYQESFPVAETCRNFLHKEKDPFKQC